MLTPESIKNHQFQNLGRGFYKTDEVDSYIDEVYSSYNLLYNENKELLRKLNILASKIEEYRNDEQAIRNAIRNAQRMASKLIDEARKEAQSIIEAAEIKAESADSITNVRIKKRIDEAEAMIKQTFDNARAQAKRATERAESDAKAVITDAKIKASEIIENAAKTSKQQLATIVEDINSQQSLLSKLREESESFKNNMIKRYEDQIHLIKSFSDFALSEIKDSFSPESFSSVATKSKVDEILESIFKEKIGSDEDFSASIDDSDDDFFFKKLPDGDVVFEDVYSSSEHEGEEGYVRPDPVSEDDIDDIFSFDSSDDGWLSGDIPVSKPKTPDDSFFSDIKPDSSDVDLFSTDGFEEFSVDGYSDKDFVFDSKPEASESKDEPSARIDRKDNFKISFDDRNDLDNTFEFDFIDDTNNNN
ncbi:MAG: DivIVA domain-containing protein [Clostridia bacterium]|nr:DivIVA domain-containing protein [Clostridia bacterium]